jgi:hypothetical protein
VTVEQAGGGTHTFHARSAAAARSAPHTLAAAHRSRTFDAHHRNQHVVPASNTRQRFVNVPVNRTLQVTELASAYTTLERPLARLARGVDQSAFDVAVERNASACRMSHGG